jgi:hypothetical protein
MHRLLPHSTLHLHPGGHVDIVTNAPTHAPVITNYLRKPGPGRRKRNTRSRNTKTGEPKASP